jgi:hypothetical protein
MRAWRGFPVSTGRWGLLRDGIPGPLDERYATLDQPPGLSYNPEGQLCVTTGHVVALVNWPLEEPLQAPLIQGSAEAQAGEPYTAIIGPEPGPGNSRWWAARRRPVHDTVEFLDPDGTVVQRHQGSLPREATFHVAGTFAQAREGKVRYRGVTGEDLSHSAERQVSIIPAIAPSAGP